MTDSSAVGATGSCLFVVVECLHRIPMAGIWARKRQNDITEGLLANSV